MPAIDGIRGISVSIVFIAHLGYERIIPGGLGVTIFFFISGFLITRLLINEHIHLNTIGLKNFFIRRLLRLYPALVFFIIVLSVIVLIFEHTINLKELSAVTFYYENYYSVLSADFPKRFQILWSLAVEEHFYIIFPFLFMLFIKRINLFLVLLMLLCFSILAIRFYITRHGANTLTDLYTYNFSHCRADSILYGCLLSVFLYADKKNKLLKPASHPAIFCTAIGALLFTILYRDELFRQTLRYTLQGIVLLFIFLAILYNNRYAFFKTLLSNNILTFIGRLSYSIYLFHWVAIYICLRFFREGSVAWHFFNISITLILSLVSYYAVERSVARLRKKFGSNVQIAIPGMQSENNESKERNVIINDSTK